jgi:hypothetical protein
VSSGDYNRRGGRGDSEVAQLRACLLSVKSRFCQVRVEEVRRFKQLEEKNRKPLAYDGPS